MGFLMQLEWLKMMKMPKVRLNKVDSTKYDLILELEKLEVNQLEQLLKLIKLYPNISSEAIEYCKEQFELQHTQSAFSCNYDKDNPLTELQSIHDDEFGTLSCECDEFHEVIHSWKNRY